MPMLIYLTDQYLYEKKRDIYVLQIINQDKSRWFFQRDNKDNLKIQKEITIWLTDNDIDYAITGPPGLLEGWTGMYYVDFSGEDDPKLKLWMSTFEDENGNSLHPEKYIMYQYSYQDWVNSGGLTRHEQHLKDMEDPDYCP